MNIRKLSNKEWAYEVSRAQHVRAATKEKLRGAKYRYYERVLGRFMPLPIVLGVAAAATLFLIYGWREFLKFFLSWIVSVTIVATVAFYVWKYYESKL